MILKNFRKAFCISGAIRPFYVAILVACFLPAAVSAEMSCTTADVIVYGGTPAGIAASIQAARLGRDVILLEPTDSVGGMMSNGLNKTDAAPTQGANGRRVYGGIVMEFFQKASARYKPDDPRRVYFESKWAEATFKNMLARAGVTVVYHERIVSVIRTARALKRVNTVSGRSFCGDAFIDASYEGDLMKVSGVTTVIGRESNRKYNESAAGVQPLARPTPGPKDVSVLVDPYKVPGDPASGLLPGIAPYVPRSIGSADHNLMGFNYRVCITQTPGNRVLFTKPADYDPLDFEATGRFVEAAQKAGLRLIPSHFVGRGTTVLGKYDMNSTPFFSTNVWNIGYQYVTANEAGRDRVRQRVKKHILGLMWFAQTDPRVPKHVRDYTATFGLCGDEFRDNGNFPRQIYVRQARRLVGQVVLTQNDLQRKTSFNDAIGLGYYPMDQHGIVRTVEDGYVADEFRKSISVGPYQIPYRAMLPKRDELINLLVPVALSSSHVAYTSIRVEPTYMVLGQAAGAAAALAPGGNVDAVNITRLKNALKAAGQVMDIPPR